MTNVQRFGVPGLPGYHGEVYSTVSLPGTPAPFGGYRGHLVGTYPGPPPPFEDRFGRQSAKSPSRSKGAPVRGSVSSTVNADAKMVKKKDVKEKAERNSQEQKEKPFQCFTCCSCFATEEAIKHHQYDTKHTQEGVAIDDAGQAVVTNRVKEKPYACLGCKKAFASLEAIGHHLYDTMHSGYELRPTRRSEPKPEERQPWSKGSSGRGILGKPGLLGDGDRSLLCNGRDPLRPWRNSGGTMNKRRKRTKRKPSHSAPPPPELTCVDPPLESSAPCLVAALCSKSDWVPQDGAWGDMSEEEMDFSCGPCFRDSPNNDEDAPGFPVGNHDEDFAPLPPLENGQMPGVEFDDDSDDDDHSTVTMVILGVSSDATSEASELIPSELGSEAGDPAEKSSGKLNPSAPTFVFSNPLPLFGAE